MAFLRQQPWDDVSVDICEAEVAPSVAVGQPLVVKAHQVQNRRMEVMDWNDVLLCLEAKIIRSTVDSSAFDAATRHPHREAVRIMITALTRPR